MLGEAEEVGELGGFGSGDVGALATTIVVEVFVGEMDFGTFGKDLDHCSDVFVDVAFWESNAVPE